MKLRKYNMAIFKLLYLKNEKSFRNEIKYILKLKIDTFVALTILKRNLLSNTMLQNIIKTLKIVIFFFFNATFS